MSGIREVIQLKVVTRVYGSTLRIVGYFGARGSGKVLASTICLPIASPRSIISRLKSYDENAYYVYMQWQFSDSRRKCRGFARRFRENVARLISHADRRTHA